MKRNILITGASRGIGRAIATQFANNKTTFILTGRDSEMLEETAKVVQDKGAKVHLVIADFSQPENVLTFLDKLDIDKLDVLVNNAGIAIVEPIQELQLESWQKTFDLNVTTPFLMIQKLLPKMPKGSTIVNINSAAGKQGFSGWSSYCMSKHALDGFTKGIRDELASLGIRIVSVYPGAVGTDIWGNIPGEQNLDSMMKPEAIASMVFSAVNQPEGTVVEDIVMRNLNDM